MTSAKATKKEIHEAALTVATSHGRNPKADDRKRLLVSWAATLEGVTSTELREAVKDYLRDPSDFMPSPGRLLTLARIYRSRHEQARPAADPADPCSCCGAKLRLLTPEEMGAPPGSPKRYGVLHDFETHRKAGVTIVGYSNQPNPEGEPV